ncbi:cation:proton antiporter [Actinoplanes sp. NPDC049548]|uniref:cation:proton antiporter n=1 Tax=Actinoplanes sp. NPDC049548 TaxID=3155152 RepID=UPI0034486BD4
MGSNFTLTVTTFGALLVVLAATALCGRLALSVRQPRVVGEMVAGVLLGPTLLGAVWPHGQHLLFPESVKSVLYVLSTLGLTFYMFLVGAEIDHKLINRSTVRRSSTLALSGIIPSFLIGAAVAIPLYGTYSTGHVDRMGFLVFVGGALAITAFPMLARILQERDIARTEIGTITLVAAAVDDVLAWILLAVIIAMSQAGDAGHALITIAGTAVFVVVMLTAGRRLLRAVATRVERVGRMDHQTIVVVLMVVLAAGWFTDYIGAFSVFGGFVTGLALPHSPTFREQLRVRLADFNSILLLPVFFAFSGLNTDLGRILSADPLPLITLLVAAVVGKYSACTVSARLQGFDWRAASAIGGLMNARGLMILVFINVGLAYDIISVEIFSMLVVVAIVTTALAMPLYSWSIPAVRERAMQEAAARYRDAPPVPVAAQDGAARV